MAYIYIYITFIVKPLTYILNIIYMSFKTGKFPSKMKLARIIIVFKEDAKNYVSSYRPISLLPQKSKILEKIFLKTLLIFLSTY